MLGALDQLDVPVPHREQVQALAGACLHREPHVFQHGEERKQVRQLECAAHALTRADSAQGCA
jgi:hypothetical protein